MLRGSSAVRLSSHADTHEPKEYRAKAFAAKSCANTAHRPHGPRPWWKTINSIGLGCESGGLAGHGQAASPVRFSFD